MTRSGADYVYTHIHTTPIQSTRFYKVGLGVRITYIISNHLQSAVVSGNVYYKQLLLCTNKNNVLFMFHKLGGEPEHLV